MTLQGPSLERRELKRKYPVTTNCCLRLGVESAFLKPYPREGCGEACGAHSGTWVLRSRLQVESLSLRTTREPVAAAPIYRQGRGGSGRWSHLSGLCQVSEAEQEPTPGSVPSAGVSPAELEKGVEGLPGVFSHPHPPLNPSWGSILSVLLSKLLLKIGFRKLVLLCKQPHQQQR